MARVGTPSGKADIGAELLRGTSGILAIALITRFCSYRSSGGILIAYAASVPYITTPRRIYSSFSYF